MGNNGVKPVHRAARAVLLVTTIFGIVCVFVVIAGYIGFEVAGRQAENAVGDFKPGTAGLYDGVYSGEYKVFGAFTGAVVEFEINDGELISIDFPRLLQTPGHNAV